MNVTNTRVPAGTGTRRMVLRRAAAPPVRHRRERAVGEGARPRSRETALLVQIEGYEALVSCDPRGARRLRARFRRIVRGMAVRHAGEVVEEAAGRSVAVFPTPLDAALAAGHAQAALAGSRGVPARIVVHVPAAGATAAATVARDLADPGNVLVLAPVTAWLGSHAEVELRPLGKFLMAGVPSPLSVALLETTTHGTEFVAVWSTPWMARLMRLGLVEPLQK